MLAMLVANALGSIGKEAVPPLMERAQTNGNNYRGRMMALDALAQVGPEARGAIPMLVQTLDDDRIEAAGRAAFALGKIGREAVPALLERLQIKNREPRGHAMAISALSWVGHEADAAVPALTEEIHDSIYGNQVGVALGSIGSAAVPTLLAMSTNDIALERERAVKAIVFAAPHGASVLSAVVKATQDVDASVRRQAIQSWGGLRLMSRLPFRL